MTTHYWEPEALIAKLKVGTRVRYRISSECPYACTDCGLDFHFVSQWGRIGSGLISRIDSSLICCNADSGCGFDGMSDYGHKFFIDIKRDNSDNVGFWAAAIELTPIEDEDVQS